jgi:hypothetical protein
VRARLADVAFFLAILLASVLLVRLFFFSH